MNYEDECNRALINRTYPEELILQVFEDDSKVELVEYLIDNFRTEYIAYASQRFDLYETFEQMIYNMPTFRVNYESELLEKWISSRKAA